MGADLGDSQDTSGAADDTTLNIPLWRQSFIYVQLQQQVCRLGPRRQARPLLLSDNIK